MRVKSQLGSLMLVMRLEVFLPGDRAFGIVNLKLGEDRADYKVLYTSDRGSNKLGSSGGSK